MPGLVMTSLARIKVRASGISSCTSSWMRSTPGPQAAKLSSAWHDGQLRGTLLREAAMVALQARMAFMLHQPRGAGRALEPVAAGAAERQRRINRGG